MSPLFPRKGLDVPAVLAKIAPPPVSSNGNGKHAGQPVVFESKAVTLSPSLFWLEGNPYLDTSADDLVRAFTAYRFAPIAYAAMRYRATKLIEAPVWIAEEHDGEEDWLDNHPLAELLERPNPDMEMADLLELVSLYRDQAGSVLLVKTRDRGGRVASLYPFHRDEFTVEPAGGRLYGRFTVTEYGGTQTILGPDDVIYLREPDPSDLHGALGPIDVALRDLNLGASMRNAVRAQLRNAIRPGSITSIKSDVPLPEEEFNRARDEILRQYANVANHGKNIVAENIEWQQIESDLAKLAVGDVNRDVEATVCMAFEIHPALLGARVGIENSASFGELLSAAQELFYDRFMFPTWSKIEKAFTRGLLREVDDNPLRFIRFVKDDVRALQDDVSAQVNEAKGAEKFWTRNEQRVHTGKPRIENRPDLDELAKPMAPADPNADPNAQRDRTESPSGTDQRARLELVKAKVQLERKDRIGNPDRKLAAVRFDEQAAADEASYEFAALSLFQEEKAVVSGSLRNDTPKAEPIATIIAVIRQLYDKKGWLHSQWVAKFRQLITRTMRTGGAGVGVATGVDFDLRNPTVEKAIERRAKNLADAVTTTTRDQLIDAVKSEPTPAAAVEKVLSPKAAKARANLIARTETIGALNEGEFLAAKESGVIRSKEWLTQGDDRVRDSHRKQDGTRVAIDARFPNGMLFPGDTSVGDPSEFCGDRCTLLYSDEPAPSSEKVAVTKPLRRSVTFVKDASGALLGAEILDAVAPDATPTPTSDATIP